MTSPRTATLRLNSAGAPRISPPNDGTSFTGPRSMKKMVKTNGSWSIGIDHRLTGVRPAPLYRFGTTGGADKRRSNRALRRRLLAVPAELKAHGGEEPVLK